MRRWREHGGFDHNAQALRTVMRIECPYPEHDGLNLTWELLEGLAKHNGPVDRAELGAGGARRSVPARAWHLALARGAGRGGGGRHRL